MTFSCIVKSHQPPKSFPLFFFEICDVQFEVENELNEHVTSVHEEKNHFKCSFCKAKFDQIFDLNEHIASVHEGKNHSNVTNVKFILV